MRLPFGLQILKTNTSKEKPHAPAQTRESYASSIFSFNAELPLQSNLGFFEVLRATIPPLDVVPIKYIRFIGEPYFECENKSIQKKLEDFYKNVQVNWLGKGFALFLYQIIDSAIAKGMGFGELVPTTSMNAVDRLKIARANDFTFIADSGNNGEIVLAQRDGKSFLPVRLKNNDLIYYLAFDQRDGHPQGYSLYHSLTFVTQILHRIQKAVENTIWRIGDPSFLVFVYGGKSTQPSVVNDAASQLQAQITNIMTDRRKGKTRDGFGGISGEDAKIEVKILGEGGEKILSSLEIPYNVVIDEMVSKTSFPSWMLGFHRGTTERLSSNEADALVANIEWYRIMLNPIIERIFSTFLIFDGDAGIKWKHLWPPVTLRDEVEQARARSLNAMAAEKEINNIITELSMGWLDKQSAEELLRANGLIKGCLTNGWFDQKLKKVAAYRTAKMLLGNQ